MTDPGDGTTVVASSEECPSCGASLAAGQRYCLECGSRRGDPRLPFMDAVVFMEAINKPKNPEPQAPMPAENRSRGISANASLIAGIATLVLAIGVGVLIGRSGDNGSATAANATPQIIKVGGGGEEESSAATGEETKSSAGKKSGNAKKGESKQAEAKAETGSSGTSKAAEEVLKPSGDVKLAKPEQEVGGKCEKGTAGCSGSGEFDGSFFGE